MSTGWLQFLLVVLPVLMLVGSWLALKRVTRGRAERGRPPTEKS